MYLTDAVQEVKVGGPSGEFLTNGSLMVRRKPGPSTSSYKECTGGDKRFLTISSQDGGEGTKIQCYFNGTTWSLNAVIQYEGASADCTSDFTTS